MKKLTVVFVLYTLLLSWGVAAQAQTANNETNQSARDNVAEERQNIRDTVDSFRDTQTETRNQFREEQEETKNTIRANTESFKETAKSGSISKEAIEEFRRKQEEARNELRTKVELFRATMEEQRNEFKQKIEDEREALRERLAQIRDERKKEIVELVYAQVNALNERAANRFSATLDKLTSVLSRIENRASKGEVNGLDVQTARDAITDAKNAISNARDAVLVQSEKVYSPAITDETALREKVGDIRKSLHNDLASVREFVVSARDAVHDAATALAKIPRINDAEVDESEATDETE